MTFKVGRCRLQECLRIAGLSQQELAAKVKMPAQQISDYANDRITMSLRNAKSIAHAIGCSIDNLYEWEQIPPSQRSRKRRQKE